MTSQEDKNPDDGTMQDLGIEIRFHHSAILEALAQALQVSFSGDVKLTPEQASDLEEVTLPCPFNTPEDVMDFCRTGNESEAKELLALFRQEFFDKAKGLRPILLQLFQKEEGLAKCLCNDLNSGELEPLDAFLLAALRLRYQDPRPRTT